MIGLALGRGDDIGQHRHRKRADGDAGQRLGHHLRGGLHQRAMEGRGHRKRNGALDVFCLGDVRHTGQRIQRAADHHLARGIVIGDDTDTTFAGRFDGDVFGLFDLGADQGSHAALAHRHGGLHRLAARFQQPRRIGQREGPGGAERGIFAQAVTGHQGGMSGDVEAEFLFHHPQHGDRGGHDGGLGILGQRQVGLGAFPHDLRQLLRQRVIDFGEDRARGRKGFGQPPAHADGL